MHIGFRLGNLKEKDHLVDPGMDGTVVLKCVIRNTTREREDWIHLAQDKDQLRAVVNTVINIL